MWKRMDVKFDEMMNSSIKNGALIQKMNTAGFRQRLK